MAERTHEISLEQFYNQIQYALVNYQSHGLLKNNFQIILVSIFGFFIILGIASFSLYKAKSKAKVMEYLAKLLKYFLNRIKRLK
jgi:hypothetical protein